ncbi:MAG TPA: tetratricopeptide repeat protein, partial [Anaerolineales bacterium]|nr:tetratricopeptide repeat protein [Anaerolineales bacterium]
PEFARAHIAELVFDRVEHEGTIAIFYRIAGQSLLKYLPLSKYERQSQLKTIFAETNSVLLTGWNTTMGFEQAVHPQQVLKNWLGFRLDAGGNTERFLREIRGVDPDVPGLLINGHVFPNPLLFARKPEPWGKVRAMDVATGFMHGDLNTNNILVKFADDKESLEGYYLIDFALFKEDMPLLYDQRYLEISYLMHVMPQISFAKCVNFITQLAVADVPDPYKAPIEMSGVSAVVRSARGAFADWVEANHASLHDDLWGQYWLAGIAAGLAYCHKAGQPNEQRLAGLIYAAANLKRFAAAFKLPLPTNVELLYDENQSNGDLQSGSMTRQPKHNLPPQPTPFIGRTKEIKALKELLLRSDTHLITLMGPGGTGKTRLSLQVAHELFDQFPDGIYFVPLADDRVADQFISRVAQQLAVREGGRPLLENVTDYLRDKNMLLVLDNFEQLVPAAPIVAALLAAAPHVKIITSSRIALNLLGEREFPVPPLEVPRIGNGSTLENLIENESILLFVERARTVHPSFALTKDNASAVAEICRRLDGLPLALELAAARIKLLQPQALLTRLDDRLKLLTGGPRDLPARHQTLRSTLEWSYDLLDQDEKILFARLGVFVGGFTLEAAEAVCNMEGSLDILEGLTTLANNSLLRQEETTDGESRFGMLETLRAYALERLAESGEMEAMRGQHARYFADVIINHIGFMELYTANASHWLNWIERENDNIRATLTWNLSTPQGIEPAAMMINVLFWFWYRRGYVIEGTTWTDRLLASPVVQPVSLLRAMALMSSGMLAVWQGKQAISLAYLQESLAIVQKLEDQQWLAPVLMGNGVALINMGRDGDAQPYFEQAVALFKEQHIAAFHAITLIHLGNVELGLGYPDKARAYHEESLAEARVINENWLISFALNNLGEVARTQGHFDQARKYYQESELLLHATGDQGDVARFVHNLGYIAQHEEDFELAEAQFRKSLTMFRRLGNRRGIAECLAGLAGLKAQQGITQWGATLLSAAESLLKATGGAWWPADRVEVERNREMLRSALTADEFANAQKAGQAMTIDQAIAFASNEV